jgi:ABC-type phosphate/phosphonate transport system ATPase subunit
MVERNQKEAILVIGRSGAGKSTILSAMYYGKEYNVLEHNREFRADN